MMIKNKKILIVIAIAIVCLIAATICLVAFLSPSRTTYYVFKGNYEAGTKITSNMLVPVEADSKIVVATSKANATTYYVTSDNFSKSVKSGDVLRCDVKKGEALQLSHISSKGGTDIEIKMAPSNVAITVPVSSITGVTDNLDAEAHVNVYAMYSTGSVQLVLENIRVLSVAKSDGNLKGVTLELTKEQAEIALEAINVGSLYLALVNHDGYIYNE